MDIWFFLMEMVMLLGSAFFLGALAQRLRQSPIVGYLLAGTIVGPLLFNTSAVNQAAELGVSLLLFSIGLEFSFNHLRKMGRIAFVGGTIQVVATVTLVTLVMVTLVALSQAITMGAIVALSSTAVVLRVLVDRAEIDSVRGQACLGILLLQDIAIVPLVLMVSLFTSTAPEISIAMHMLKITASIVGLAAVLYLLLYHAVPTLLSGKELFANRELSVLLATTVGLGAAWASHAIHISPALGAFVAGMLLGESPFATQIRADIGALRTIMVTLFFASIGMLVKPHWFITHMHWIAMVAVLIFTLKTVIIYAVGRIFSLDNRQALATGITLGQIGEFSFVLAATARGGGILDSDTFDLIVSVIIVLIFSAPYMVKYAIPFSERFISLLSRRVSKTDVYVHPDAVMSNNQVLVVGLGPAGLQVVHTLIKRQLEPVVIDVNPHSRKVAQQLGIKIHLGDAANEEVLIHAGIKEVCMAVVTVPDWKTAVSIIRMLRDLRPQLSIAARCRYNRYLADLEKAGADIVIDEESTVGQMLTQRIIEHIQESSGSIFACRMAGQTPEVSI
jgi:CPA2 family monovalent cation:H+ antiporter-2